MKNNKQKINYKRDRNKISMKVNCYKNKLINNSMKNF